MLVNLSDVFTSREKVLEEEIPLEMTEVKNRLGIFKILEKKPVSFVLTNIKTGKALIEGKTELVFEMNCDRCLKTVEYKMDLNFSREVYSPDASLEDADEDDDDQSFMVGYELNVEDLVSNEILLSWPMKVLCKPQCKGICTFCGKDLNTGECGCDTFVPDPRWAALQDIFNANKEV